MSAAEQLATVSARDVAERLGMRPFSVRRRAEREGWPHVVALGNGGEQRLYLRHGLPEDVATALVAPSPVQSTSAYMTARQVDRDRADEALACVQAWRSWWERARRHTPKREAQRAFCAAWAVQSGCTVADRTLREWDRRYREGGVSGLVPQWRGPSRAEVPEEFQKLFLTLYMQPQRPKLSTCHDYTVCILRKDHPGVRAPSLSAVRRWVKAEIDPQVLTYARDGATAWRNKHCPYIERDFSMLRSNDVWESDHHEFDIWCKGPVKGKPVRPWLTAWYDRHSRKFVGWHIFDGNPCSDTILLGFRRGVRTHGVPKALYIDNGKDYRSNAITGGRPGGAEDLERDNRRVQSLCAQLDMAVTFALPYNARAKIIERAFETVKDRFGRFVEGFCGGSPAERPEKMPRWESLPTVAKVAAAFEEWVELEYHRTPHSETGVAPTELWAQDLEEKRTAPDELLRLALLKSTEPRVLRRNGVELRGLWYDAPELRSLHGRKFYLRYDPAAMGSVDLYDEEDRFVCTATNRAALDASADHETVRRAIAEQRRLEKEVRAGAKALTELALGGDPMERFMAARRAETSEAAPAPEGAKVLRMVTPTVRNRRGPTSGTGLDAQVVDLASRAKATQSSTTVAQDEAPSGLAFLQAATEGARRAREMEDRDGRD